MQRGHAIVRNRSRWGDRWMCAADPVEVVVANGADAFPALDRMADGGFWVGFCSYDLGRAIERVMPHTADDTRLPDLAFARFDTWRPYKPQPRSREPLGSILGDGRSSLSRAEHATAIDAVHGLLRAGECYQVNLTRHLRFPGAPEPRAVFDALVAHNPAPYAGMWVPGPALPGVAVISASPELFLGLDGRDIETRPIKGTATDAATLAQSAKDRAEHVMIVDLARNDLGRVCTFGSVGVRGLCTVEDHPGLYHMVSTVQGRLREDVTLGGLVRATFPAASITGAPKPRVMQAIEDLEPVRRGVYCGAFGWIDGDAGRAELAVAIRTLTIAAGQTHLGVGGGIVADSEAGAEWAETELKAARLLEALGTHEAEPARSR